MLAQAASVWSPPKLAILILMPLDAEQNFTSFAQSRSPSVGGKTYSFSPPGFGLASNTVTSWPSIAADGQRTGPPVRAHHRQPLAAGAARTKG